MSKEIKYLHVYINKKLKQLDYNVIPIIIAHGIFL